MAFSAARIFSLIDLTRLENDGDAKAIDQLIAKSQGPLGSVAAICVYGDYITQVQTQFSGKIASVCNFPQGNQPLAQTLNEIQQLIAAGVDEIDCVLPYTDYIEGRRQQALDYIRACRDASQGKTLKVIVESGAFSDQAQLTQACGDLIELDVDFLKTSTGKIATGATVEAAATMLDAIKASCKRIGFKVSGGVANSIQAQRYLQLVAEKLGEDWLTPELCRIGASRLVDELLSTTAENSAVYKTF